MVVYYKRDMWDDQETGVLRISTYLTILLFSDALLSDTTAHCDRLEAPVLERDGTSFDFVNVPSATALCIDYRLRRFASACIIFLQTTGLNMRQCMILVI